ncbi:hypothetical protein V8G54_021394 [Vigna mungo]|uniref:Uncharacterized protein n=1 Tax=Vigna mungo TaxID=3915 RepID=A0AAQ3NHA4_VIGMU
MQPPMPSPQHSTPSPFARYISLPLPTSSCSPKLTLQTPSFAFQASLNITPFTTLNPSPPFSSPSSLSLSISSSSSSRRKPLRLPSEKEGIVSSTKHLFLVGNLLEGSENSNMSSLLQE